MFDAYPRLDIVPELRCQRQHIGSLFGGHGRRRVVGHPVAFTAKRVELAHQRRIDPNGMPQRLDGKRMMPWNIGVGAIPCGVHGRSSHGKGCVVRELKSPLRAQSANTRVSEISIGQREQAGDFLC